MGAPTDCLPVEIWRDILLFAIESDVGPSVFATTCTASTFIHFDKQGNNSYIEYMTRRATLRRVCHAWNQFILSTDSWWTRVHAPVRSQETVNLSFIPDQSPTVKRLSMIVPPGECVGPSVNWASDLLQRVQVPPIFYDVTLPLCHGVSGICRERHERDDFLAVVGSNMALRRLRALVSPLNRCRDISFPHLSANFKNLVSLTLCNMMWLSTEKLTLPHLELLSLTRYTGKLPSPTQGWNLPCLRHVWVEGNFDIDLWLKFLLRYASQLETLCLITRGRWDNFPNNFWDSFTALQLLGLPSNLLNDRGWGGWITRPPHTHPFRYLVCWSPGDLMAKVDSIRSMWTYHEEVGLVIDYGTSNQHYLIEDIKKEGWKKRMKKSDGILPNRRQSLD